VASRRKREGPGGTRCEGKGHFLEAQTWLEEEAGASLYLTLDSVIQHLVEDELEQPHGSAAPQSHAVVTDPSDGRILAMASYPRVNPNAWSASGRNFGGTARAGSVRTGLLFKVFSLGRPSNTAPSPAAEHLCQKGACTLGQK